MVRLEGITTAGDRDSRSVPGILGRTGDEVLADKVAVHLEVGDEPVQEEEVSEGGTASATPTDLGVVTGQFHGFGFWGESTDDVGVDEICLVLEIAVGRVIGVGELQPCLHLFPADPVRQGLHVGQCVLGRSRFGFGGLLGGLLFLL